MFDTPMREIIPFYKKGGKVSLINKSIVKKKKMKQKQTQKQIVNIYNTKPAQRKRVYKKTDDKKEPQRMPVYYTQPQYNQYLPAPTITMPTKLPTMTADTKLPTPTGLTTGLKTTQETGTSPEFDAEFNTYMNDKQIYEDEREKMKRKQKELIEFFRTTPYKDEPLPSILDDSNILPNFNYGLEKLQPPNPIKPPQAEYKDPSAFSEYDDREDDEVYNEPPEEAPSLVSDVPANKRYSEWTLSQLQQETINRKLYTITKEPKQGQPRNADGNRPKTRKELINGLNTFDREKEKLIKLN